MKFNIQRKEWEGVENEIHLDEEKEENGSGANGNNIWNPLKVLKFKGVLIFYGNLNPNNCGKLRILAEEIKNRLGRIKNFYMIMAYYHDNCIAFLIGLNRR